MSWKTIWELVKINILYSNPQVLESIRKKRAKNPQKDYQSYKAMFRQQGLMMVLMLLVYANLFMRVDYSAYPLQFTVQLALFMLISLVQGFTGFFSIFYDSKDTKLYLSLPVKLEEVFMAKLLSGQTNLMTFLMPLLALLGIAYVQVTGSFLALLLVIPIFLVILILLNLVSLLLLHIIGEVLAKSPHKKLVSTILMVLSTLLAFGTIFFIQSSAQLSLATDEKITIPVFSAFYDIVAQPLAIGTWINSGAILLIILGLGVLTYHRIIPSYFRQILAMEATQAKKKIKIRNSRISDSLTKTMIRHHLSTLGEANLIIQTYLMPIIYILMFIPALMTEKLSLANLRGEFFGSSLITGAVMGSYFALPTSFLGVGLSLEKENYTFLKTLPVNFKSFVWQKFLVLSGVQHGLPVLVYLLVLTLLFKAPLVLILGFMIGLLTVAWLVGQFVYWRDYRLLHLTWQNINQLFSRGASQIIIGLGIFVAMIAGITLVIGSIFATIYLNSLAVNITIILFFTVLALVSQFWIKKSFWDKF
ncbi:hypothetical protein ACVR05_04260 [Streptococcus caprae]|uniref:ABC transporter permease n=1 Tax=Streptococcus caprae TaxID=1640501 RepID=A0ABV8CXW6_9STRE